jgi:lipopolysaccharide/colanic/teichoic acid biosynthesis glycosyltransferase
MLLRERRPNRVSLPAATIERFDHGRGPGPGGLKPFVAVGCHGRRANVGAMSVAASAYPPYRGKRAFDLAVLAVVALPAAALGVGCALAVRLTSPGPVLFTQERVGRDGKRFTVLKFRTMVAGDNPIFPDATRITRAGRWLRRLSLDELPQLVNVGLGEMSIVGPRPTLDYQVERYDDRQRLRLCVRPGLTGLAQVNGRNELSWSDRIDWDITYVQTQSLGTDLRILARTFATVATGRGAEGHPADDPLAVAPGTS